MYKPSKTSQEIEHGSNPIKEMGIRQSENTWHMDMNDVTIPSKEIVHTMEYAYNLFSEERETENVNENAPKIWFWKNVAFVFSIGAIFEENDHKIFDQMMLYFDKHEDAYFPNKNLVYDYRHSNIVKHIENFYDISPGNYHLLMSVVVMNADDLANAPEPIYRKYGPVFASVDIKEIVHTMMELFTKYGAVKKYLGATLRGTLGIAYDVSKSGTHGLPREMLKDESIRRMYRKGFLDFEANDGYEEIKPEMMYHPDAVKRQWFDEEDNGNNFRKRRKLQGRGKGTAGYIRRSNNQHSLYNQIHNPVEIVQKPSGDEMKAVQYRMDFYKETAQNRIDKPQYEIYEIEGYETMDNSDKHVESTIASEKDVICPHISLNDPIY